MAEPQAGSERKETSGRPTRGLFVIDFFDKGFRAVYRKIVDESPLRSE